MAWHFRPTQTHVRSPQVLLDGKDLKGLNVHWLRSQVSFVCMALLFVCSYACVYGRTFPSHTIPRKRPTDTPTPC